jgi:outer membrane scaffolding protein for murein synthesis (MipA/OmpV family)
MKYTWPIPARLIKQGMISQKEQVMKKELKRVLAATSVCMLGAASGSFAATSVGGGLDDGTVPVVKATTYTVGLGVAAIPQYEGSKDSKGAPVPFFRAQMSNGMYLQLMGATLTANLLPDKTWQAGPLLRYRGERKPEDIDNFYVKYQMLGKAKVDAAKEVGGFVSFQANQWNARLEAAADVGNGHEGGLATLSGGYTFPLSDVASVALNLSSTYASDNYMDAYFSGPIVAGYTPIGYYTAGAGIKDVSVAVIGRYRIDNNWGLLGAVRLTELTGDAADSPVVKNGGSSSQMVVGVLATYTF